MAHCRGFPGQLVSPGEPYSSHQCPSHARNLYHLTDRLLFAIEADELATRINMTIKFCEKSMVS